MKWQMKATRQALNRSPLPKRGATALQCFPRERERTHTPLTTHLRVVLEQRVGPGGPPAGLVDGVGVDGCRATPDGGAAGSIGHHHAAAKELRAFVRGRGRQGAREGRRGRSVGQSRLALEAGGPCIFPAWLDPSLCKSWPGCPMAPDAVSRHHADKLREAGRASEAHKACPHPIQTWYPLTPQTPPPTWVSSLT